MLKGIVDKCGIFWRLCWLMFLEFLVEFNKIKMRNFIEFIWLCDLEKIIL